MVGMINSTPKPAILTNYLSFNENASSFLCSPDVFFSVTHLKEKEKHQISSDVLPCKSESKCEDMGLNCGHIAKGEAADRPHEILGSKKCKEMLCLSEKSSKKVCTSISMLG